MAFSHGKGTEVFAGGYDLTAYLNKIEFSGAADIVETSVFGDSSKTFIPGLLSSSMSGEGLYDQDIGVAADRIDDILSATFGTVQTMAYYPVGDVIGYAGHGAKFNHTGYTIISTIDQAVKIAIAGIGNTAIERIVSVHAKGAETVNGSAASVDNGAATVYGGSGYVFVTAVSGTISTLLLEHSVDDVVWTTLATFTNPTTIGAERVTFTGTVKRYIRATWTGTAYSITFNMAVSRNQS